MTLSLLQQPLLIGAWIGLIHAFDADHVSTLGSLAVRGRPRSSFGYAMRWACGHAVAISVLGAIAAGVDMLWIVSLSHYAEMIVAALLIALGTNAIASVLRPAPTRSTVTDGSRRRHSAGLLMGLLHGGAGSAAVLAILPLAGYESGFDAAWFLTFFSIGVAAGAMLFAALFALVLARAVCRGRRIIATLTCAVGGMALLVGLMMLLETLHAG
jgi:cytochrome c biogenesis protein CcdA